MAIIPYRPVRGYGATLNGDAQLEDFELQDADLTQPGVVMRGPGARELAARVHVTGGTEAILPADGGQALFYRPDVDGDELCMVHDDTLYGSRPTEVTVNGTQAWREIGTWAPWTLRQKALHQPINFVTDCDVATIRDSATGKLYHVAVWEQQNSGVFGKPAAPGVYVIALDESGAVVAPATVLEAGVTMVNPRACACDTGVVIVWHNTATATWRGSAWRLSNPIEFATAVNLVAGSAGTAPLHDLRKDGANDRVILALADSIAAFGIPLRLVTVSLVVTSLGAVAVAQAPSVGLSVDVDPLGGYLLAWADATTANAVHVNNAGAVDTVIATQATANPPARITACHVDGVASQGTVAVEQRVGASQDFRGHVQTFSYNGAALASVRTQRGAIIWGHAVVYRGRPVAWAEHWSGDVVNQGVQILFDLLTGDVLARAWGDGLGTNDTKGALYTMPSTPQVVGVYLYQAAAPVATAGASVFNGLIGSDIPQCIAVTRVDGSPQPRNPATVTGYVFDAHAGYPVIYDGQACEADWHVLPDIPTVALPAGAIAAGTYVLAATYKWIARDGTIWRSEPFVRSVVVAGAQLIQPTVTPCRWTARDEVLIEFWLSQAGQGSPLYLAATIVSNPAVDAQTTNITAVPATTAEQLDQFVPSGILGHGRTQVTDYMAYVLGRFWSPDPQRADILRFTIEHDIGRDGFGWGWEATQIQKLDTSVRSQAAGEIDGTLAVLAGSECHLVFGLGPDKQGAGLFGQPSKFGVVDLETSQARVARVPDSAVPGGLAYATPRGLYLLRRDRVSQPLSTQVDRLFRFDGVAPQSVAYVPEYGEFFLMTRTIGARSLRLSLLTGRWCADSARRAQDVAVSPRGEASWLLTDSRVRILDETLIADGSDNLQFQGTTPTIRLAPENVSQAGTMQALLVHTYLITGPATLEFQIQDRRTGENRLSSPITATFSAAGPESRALTLINLSTYGHRVSFSQPAGTAGKIAIVEIDHQVQPDDKVIARTLTTL